MPEYLSFEATRSWNTSLGLLQTDNAAAVERLRSEFLKLHERAGILMNEVHRNLPDFTAHDVAHCDALWEMADHVGDVELNPAEGFVLGAVFLLHDAAMGLAALPGRLQELRQDPLWRDVAVANLRRQLGHRPTTAEVNALESGTDIRAQQSVTAEVLRARHADYAELLALVEYRDVDGQPFYLIEDEILRTHFGRDIGRIAASHGWPLERITQEFAHRPSLAAPIAAGCPPEWQVNRLKLACLIRTCDAIHLDARRAPGFLRVVRRPTSGADPHWQFQRRITVHRHGDRIHFSSGYAFPASEASSWWTGYELIQNADRELRQVDALLADLGHTRFAARSAFGADSPARLAQAVPTQDWEPVEARIRVSDVAVLARSLGGENLYGRHSRGSVPLRELIQNGCDAVRARRILQTRYAERDQGEITVHQGWDEQGHWIEVEDNGLGMSPAVLTGPLLDFGASLWNTFLQHQEWPGLSGGRFEATGRFGIGFFSVFMWGVRVRVTSRRYDKGVETSHVIEWEKGLNWHPLLRLARPDEQLQEGGTRVRVWLTASSSLEAGALDSSADAIPVSADTRWDLETLCRWLCPTLDVHLHVAEDSDLKVANTSPQAALVLSISAASHTPSRNRIIQAGDWIEGDGRELLRRVWSDYYNFNHLKSPELLDKIVATLRHLRSSSGDVIGRACLFPWQLGFEIFDTSNYRCGCVTVGGLHAAELTGIAGVLVGEAARAARDEAVPLVEAEELARWATEQATLFPSITTDVNHQLTTATVVRRCGGLTGPLMIAATGIGHEEGTLYLSHDDIAAMRDLPDELAFLDFQILQGARLAESVRLHPHVYLTGHDLPFLLFRAQELHQIDWNPGVPQHIAEVSNPDWANFRSRTLFGAFIEAVAVSWGCSIDAVIHASTLNTTSGEPPITPEKREIGLVNGQPLLHEVGLLRRPT